MPSRKAVELKRRFYSAKLRARICQSQRIDGNSTVDYFKAYRYWEFEAVILPGSLANIPSRAGTEAGGAYSLIYRCGAVRIRQSSCCRGRQIGGPYNKNCSGEAPSFTGTLIGTKVPVRCLMGVLS